MFTHLSHVYGEGSSIYTTYVFRPAASYAATLERWKRLKHAASQAIVDNRGTISHQHGVGKDHAPYLPREKGELGVRRAACHGRSLRSGRAAQPRHPAAGLSGMTSAWNEEWRRRRLPALAGQEWDLIVVGGGISGAGILREAARRGWRCLLLEQRDFAWGTSSRSSKMVHGGLRYIAKGQWRLTRDSVRERQRLLGEAPGLVEPLSFVMAHYRGGFPGPRLFGGLLSVYDAPCRAAQPPFLRRRRVALPGAGPEGTTAARRHAILRCGDRRCAPGAAGAGRGASRRRRGIQRHACARIAARGRPGGRPARRGPRERRAFDFRCRALALATGAWADELRQPGGSEHIRSLRGSHLLLPAWRLPVAHAFSFMHATDRRPVFVFPGRVRRWSAPPISIIATALGRTRGSAAPNSTTCWRPAPSSFPPLPSRRATCCRPGPACDRWSAAATTAASLPTRNASMCSGASRAA